MRRRHPSKGEHMSDFVEFIWMWAVGMILMVTLPIWFIPYTAFKVWEYFKGNT
jgi:hypothetical protein